MAAATVAARRIFMFASPSFIMHGVPLARPPYLAWRMNDKS
jgi:hypothetical protein